MAERMLSPVTDLFFFFTFKLKLYCPVGIFLMGKLGSFPQGKPAVEVMLPDLLCMLGF